MFFLAYEVVATANNGIGDLFFSCTRLLVASDSVTRQSDLQADCLPCPFPVPNDHQTLQRPHAVHEIQLGCVPNTAAVCLWTYNITFGWKSSRVKDRKYSSPSTYLAPLRALAVHVFKCIFTCERCVSWVRSLISHDTLQ